MGKRLSGGSNNIAGSSSIMWSVYAEHRPHVALRRLTQAVQDIEIRHVVGIGVQIGAGCQLAGVLHLVHWRLARYTRVDLRRGAISARRADMIDAHGLNAMR